MTTKKIKSLKRNSDLQNQILKMEKWLTKSNLWKRHTTYFTGVFNIFESNESKTSWSPSLEKKEKQHQLWKEEKKRHDDHQTHKVFLPTLQLSSGP